MRLSREDYRDVVRWTEQLRPTRQCMRMLKERFPAHSQSTLLSIFSLEYQKRIKRTISRHHAPDVIESHYQRYLSAAKAHPTAPVLLELANEVDLSPALMARIILERFLQDQKGEMRGGWAGMLQRSIDFYIRDITPNWLPHLEMTKPPTSPPPPPPTMQQKYWREHQSRRVKDYLVALVNKSIHSKQFYHLLNMISTSLMFLIT